MKLVDKKELLKLAVPHTKGTYGYSAKVDDWAVMVKDIKNLPVVDAEPVNHAHWVTRVVNGGYMHTICSHCGAEIADSYANAHPNLYCDNCGYKMDEV